MNKTTRVKREEAEWAFLSGHSPRLVRKGRIGLGQECITGRGDPRSSQRKEGKCRWGSGRSGSSTPCPNLCRPITNPPTGRRRGGREGLGPSSVHLKRPMCANQQEGGVRSRCPHLTAPLLNRQQKQGWGQRQYCFTHHAWRGWAMGQEEVGWIGGVSQAPCPLPPWQLRWQDSEAHGGPGMANPPWGQAVPRCSPLGLALP